MAGTLNEHSHGLAPTQMRSERKRSTDAADFDAICHWMSSRVTSS
jgi:hypothetical protein